MPAAPAGSPEATPDGFSRHFFTAPMAPAAALSEARGRNVIFYDGECLFCQGWVRWLMKRDRDRAWHFAPLQGELAARVLAGTELAQALSTVVLAVNCLTERQEIFVKSSAAGRIAARLPFPWRLGGLLLAVPRPLRDGVYDAIARRRHSLKKTVACPLPTAEESARFFS